MFDVWNTLSSSYPCLMFGIIYIPAIHVLCLEITMIIYSQLPMCVSTSWGWEIVGKPNLVGTHHWKKIYTTGFNPIATHGQSLSWAAGNTDLMADPFRLKLDGSGGWNVADFTTDIVGGFCQQSVGSCFGFFSRNQSRILIMDSNHIIQLCAWLCMCQSCKQEAWGQMKPLQLQH